MIVTSSQFNPAKDLVALNGKVAIVTGGNTGIGYATVQHLARAGAKVYLAARNEERAMNAIVSLREAGLTPGSGEVLWLKLDLSDPRDAKKAAEEFLRKEMRLDILVNNAAMMSAPFEKSEDGISTIVAVNYISPFAFTRTLLPLLTKTAKEPNSDVRIVNLTSIAHKLATSSVSFKVIEDLNVAYNRHLLPWFFRYAHSKLLVLLWTKALHKHLSSAESLAPITVIAVHPGGVDTFTQRWPFPRFSKWLVGLVIADLEHGAYNSVFAAASKRVGENRDIYNGSYIESRPTGKITKVGKFWGNEALATDLWSTTESFLGGIGL